MKKYEVVMHIFAHEMHDFQRLTEQLKRCLSFVDTDSWCFDITLNVSSDYYDWNTSELTTGFFTRQFEGLCNLLPNVHYNVIYEGQVGCNSVRRKAARTSKSDYVIYLDTDLHFSIYSLYFLQQVGDKSNKDQYNIVSGQIPRLWDDSWNIISNQEYIDMGIESKIWLKLDPYNIDKLVLDKLDKISVKELPYIKIGGGWLNMIETKLLNKIDIPDSFGPYGRDDTFVAQCANILNERGYTVKQYILDNLLVCENRLFESYEPYLDYLSLKNTVDGYKQSHAEKAENLFQNEITQFVKRL